MRMIAGSVVFLVLVSCGKRELCFLEPPREGVIKIEYNWDKVQTRSVYPDAINLYFYSASAADSVEVIGKNTPSSEVSFISMPEGEYNLFGRNETPTIRYRKMENSFDYEAYVSGKTEDGKYMLAQPEVLYGLKVENISVRSHDTLQLKLMPESYTEEVYFIVRISGMDNIVACEGELTGTSQFFFLLACHSCRQRIGVTPFTMRAEGSAWMSRVIVFSVNPARSGKIEVANMLKLHLTKENGEVITVNKDITSVLDHIENKRIEVEIEVTGGQGVGFNINVLRWAAGKDSIIEVS